MLALASGAPALLVGALSGVLIAHLGATGSAIRKLIETTVSTVTTPRCSARCW